MSAVIVGLIFGMACVVALVRFRQRGPAVAGIPRRWRPRLNAWYRKHGWPVPFDEDGNNIQRF